VYDLADDLEITLKEALQVVREIWGR
jgi:hypothetical protein